MKKLKDLLVAVLATLQPPQRRVRNEDRLCDFIYLPFHVYFVMGYRMDFGYAFKGTALRFNRWS